MKKTPPFWWKGMMTRDEKGGRGTRAMSGTKRAAFSRIGGGGGGRTTRFVRWEVPGRVSLAGAFSTPRRTGIRAPRPGAACIPYCSHLAVPLPPLDLVPAPFAHADVRAREYLLGLLRLGIVTERERVLVGGSAALLFLLRRAADAAVRGGHDAWMYVRMYYYSLSIERETKWIDSFIVISLYERYDDDIVVNVGCRTHDFGWLRWRSQP